jgi:hypothetical protein
MGKDSAGSPTFNPPMSQPMCRCSEQGFIKLRHDPIDAFYGGRSFSAGCGPPWSGFCVIWQGAKP